MNIVADIGGTKMRIGGVRDGMETFETPVILATPQSYDEALALFVDTAHKIAGNEAIASVAIGVPAVLSSDKRSIVKSEHLAQWADHAFADDIGNALAAKVHLENDTALVGLGEAAYGAGAGASIVAYITISTGVNGVRIIEGTIDRAAVGFEIGGQYLDHTGELASLESLISGSAVHEREGVHPRDLGKAWSGWEDLARIAAIGLHNTILHWSPDRVVLGGSMMNEIGIPIESIRTHLAAIMQKFPQVPEVVHSKLHDEGGLYGGLAILKRPSK